MLVTVISTMFIGWVSIFTGAFEIVHAFWTKGWGGFVWQVLLGILYVAFGAVLVSQPVASALILTYVLGMVLLISGIVRILLGISHWREAGWVMLLSGVFGVLAGLVILTGFPMTGLWVLGFLLGVDLISHGIGWLAYARLPTANAASSACQVRPDAICHATNRHVAAEFWLVPNFACGRDRMCSRKAGVVIVRSRRGPGPSGYAAAISRAGPAGRGLSCLTMSASSTARATRCPRLPMCW